MEDTAADTTSGAAGMWQKFVLSRDSHIRRDLIEFYRPLARKIAARMYVLRRDGSVGFSDYLQYASVGLVEAVDRFEPGRLVLFETFATYRVRGAILNGLAKESELAAQRHYWATRAQERLESLKSHSSDAEGPTDLLAELVEVTVGLAFGVLLESRAEPADEAPSANPYAATELAELVRRLRRAVDSLPERERSIIELHYYHQEAFQDIAARFEVTKGRISQLHSRALRLLRAALEADSAKADVTF